ncbi:MAG: hypothetical protein PHV68_07150, partial [Candidatus Gastranaerophilales bacterium]|nr:hypothetical protein [Candidatus Gastranaerophilales bacterium]
MNTIRAIGKTLDQKILIGKLNNVVPRVLTASAVICTVSNTIQAPSDEKKSIFIKNVCIWSGTILSALAATKVLNKNTPLKNIVNGQKQIVENFVGTNTLKDTSVKNILEKAKSKVLSLNEVKILYNNLDKTEKGSEFLEKLIPSPIAKNFKEEIKEVGKLSILGLLPVTGGVLGGISGDKLIEKNWIKKIPNKIKEGFYQYFANIFLCNVGAIGALSLMKNVKSKSVKMAG